jgi:hypothetical protein
MVIKIRNTTAKKQNFTLTGVDDVPTVELLSSAERMLLMKIVPEGVKVVITVGPETRQTSATITGQGVSCNVNKPYLLTTKVKSTISDFTFSESESTPDAPKKAACVTLSLVEGPVRGIAPMWFIFIAFGVIAFLCILVWLVKKRIDRHTREGSNFLNRHRGRPAQHT